MLRTRFPMDPVVPVNLMEEPQGASLPLEDGAVRLTLKPLEIVTLRIAPVV